MAARACVFNLILLLAVPIAREGHSRFIVWNVGQGLWTTMYAGAECWHFDMGGEFAPWGEILRLCRGTTNVVHLSHWDSDHISFTGRANYLLPNICRAGLPAGEPSPRKKKMVRRMRECGHAIPYQEWFPAGTGPSNDMSSIVAWNGVVIPGDSSKTAEKKWVPTLSGVESTRVLVLGHHGSRTSTGNLLLKSMPELRMAVASARRKRYGHPHEEVRQILNRKGVALLNTEDWGNLVFWLE